MNPQGNSFHPVSTLDNHHSIGGRFNEKDRNGMPLSDVNQMGFFGNVWIRSHYYKKTGTTNGGGHRHKFDHVTLLVKGSVLIEVEGFESKIFHAPTFITIKKEYKHKITSLEDDVLYYCVFALRDIDGEVTELYNGDNSPYGSLSDDEYEQKYNKLNLKTSHD